MVHEPPPSQQGTLLSHSLTRLLLDTVHRSKVVDLVKGEGDADDQTLKVAMPANQLNTGITVSCHRRAFDLGAYAIQFACWLVGWR